MKVLHTTPLQNVESIYRYGLLTSYAQTPQKVIWLTPPRLRAWARGHVRARHRLGVAGPLAVFELLIDRRRLHVHPSGLLVCQENIPSEYLRLLRPVPEDGVEGG